MYTGPERKKIRTEFWNYSNNGNYFITICCKNRQDYFGEIRNGFMGLNEFGLIAFRNFLDIPNHFLNVEIDEFVIMPNHIHGIINIRRGQACLAPTDKSQYQKIPVIIGSYKSAVTKNIHQIDPDTEFKWQRSYHDRIIRNEDELNKIRFYIKQNPANWEKPETI